MTTTIRRVEYPNPHAIDNKRCHAPYIINYVCPKCGTAWECDLRDRYLNYPEVGKPHEVEMWCETCEDDTVTCHVIVDITVDLVTP